MSPARVRPPLHRDLARSTRRDTARCDTSDDAGFTVVEALVSFVLLAVVGAAAITAVITGSRTSKTSSDRVNASNLAQQDQQAARALRWPNYPAAVTARTVTVGSTRYTVTRTVSSACPSQPNYDTNPYMFVTSTVSWPPATPATQVALTTELAC